MRGGIYEKLMREGFGPCADTFYDQWNDLEYSPMFQSFTIRNDTLAMAGKGWHFLLSLSAGPGELIPFSGSLLSRLDSTTWSSFHGVSDSVKYWSILFPDSVSLKARIALSRSMGLIKIPDCELLLTDPDPIAETHHYLLFSMADSVSAPMFAQPSIDTFYPYSQGDELFFYYERFVWDAEVSNIWERQYWYVTADSVGTKNGQPRLFGKCDRFDENRAIIRLGEHFVPEWNILIPGFEFDYPYNVPHPKGFKSELRLKENEFVMEVHASYYDTSFCDWYIDGPSITAIYSSAFGMMEESSDAGFQGHRFIKLLAARVSGETYGIWPQWLGREERGDEAVNIYPNPVSGKLWVETAHRGQGETRLFSSEGSLITKGEINDGRGETDVSALPNGIYLLHITHGETSFSKTLVVMH